MKIKKITLFLLGGFLFVGFCHKITTTINKLVDDGKYEYVKKYYQGDSDKFNKDLDKIYNNNLDSMKSSLDREYEKTQQSIRREDSLKKLPSARVQKAYSEIAARAIAGKNVNIYEINEFKKLSIDLKDTEYSKRINKTLDSLESKYKILKETEKSLARKIMETTLRNNFLDNNLDIKVKVSGKNNTILKLTYPLFNDVWFRKLQKEGTFNNLHEMGFERIILSDNYNYERYIYWD